MKKRIDEDKMVREAEVFGLNHKFAVNADECDITKDQSQASQMASTFKPKVSWTGNTV